MVLIILLTGLVIYFFKYAEEPAVILQEESGLTILGYDRSQKRWLINEYAHYWLGLDGPHVFYNHDGRAEAVYVAGDTTNLRVVRQPLASPLREPLLCRVDNTVLSSFSFPLRDSLSVQPCRYPVPSKLLAISDIEGNFRAFARMLIGNGVTDTNLRWTFGDGHLVLLGDFMDRGINVTQCLWLIYKLEEEARLAGGHVHFILGNHEQLNLQGVVKYVDPKYKELRRRLDIPYASLFGPGTELGRWLRTKNTIEKIGSDVYMHGGISPQIATAGYSLEEINTWMRNAIDKKEDEIGDARARTLLGMDGILWYRGYVEEYRGKPKIGQHDVESVLRALGAERLIIGHTVVDEISPDYGNRLVRLDVKHAEAASQALLLEEGKSFRTDPKGSRSPL